MYDKDEENNGESELCLVCDASIDNDSEDITTIKTKKGVATINNYCKKQGLSWRVKNKVKDFRKLFIINHIKKSALPNDPNRATTHLSWCPPVNKPKTEQFDYHTCCLF